ncbi:SDR family NAD(P)-dependent oxidoreductase [Nocardia macrotermitis]|uniref:Putative oxidoreductase n=1 Tax=Nocardia macrotermitis TaxID=2585198 RepID=A0A7K0D782_9NOCA|nr:SDR family oxidoreductase [Nocardia macrotermitis]MQY21568.1 putative oxidoreductase [Nocardia macrotermitis]
MADNEFQDSEFRDRVAFITGGGRGFGKAFGAALSARGARVVLADIDGEAATSAAAELSANGADVTGLACDVADESGVAAAMDAVATRHGGLDILVNNAGLHAAYNRPFHELGLSTVQRVFDVNVMGTVMCTMAAHPLMTGRPGAAIVNISSSAAYGNHTVYGVSKLAVRGLTMSFAREYAADGIRVNAIAPGLILTDTVRAELPEADLKRVLGQQLLSRAGSETDIVDALLYLASSKSAFITGETLRVTGGFALSA